MLTKKLWKKLLKKIVSVAVDGVVVKGGKALLMKRAIYPWKGYWIVPGGRVEHGETLEKAVVREAKEEVGLKTKVVALIGALSEPQRDPRGHVVSIGFLLKPLSSKIKTNFEASEAKWFSLNALPQNIGAGHRKLVLLAKKFIKEKRE